MLDGVAPVPEKIALLPDVHAASGPLGDAGHDVVGHRLGRGRERRRLHALGHLRVHEPGSHHQHLHPGTGQATPEELSTTAEGQRLLAVEKNADLESRRHGRGPRQGEFVPEFTEHGVQKPSGQLLTDQAQLHGTIKLIERWKAEMPTEQEMLPRDKYTIFDRGG